MMAHFYRPIKAVWISSPWEKLRSKRGEMAVYHLGQEKAHSPLTIYGTMQTDLGTLVRAFYEQGTAPVILRARRGCWRAGEDLGKLGAQQRMEESPGLRELARRLSGGERGQSKGMWEGAWGGLCSVRNSVLLEYKQE